jgi:hypothetical protein
MPQLRIPLVDQPQLLLPLHFRPGYLSGGTPQNGDLSGPIDGALLLNRL